jgi:hypothetical protein
MASRATTSRLVRRSESDKVGKEKWKEETEILNE